MMESLRTAAFDNNDERAGQAWAMRLHSLGGKCFTQTGDATAPCQLLAREALAAADRYYGMWTDALGMWAKQHVALANGVESQPAAASQHEPQAGSEHAADF